MGRDKSLVVKSQDSVETKAELGAADDGVTYSLIFINNSLMDANACVYQQDPSMTNPNVMSLAWFSKYAFSDSKVVFSWQIDYNFVWAQTGQLIPGVVFVASQTLDANLSTTNEVTLNYDAINDAYDFSAQTPGTPGTLTINESSSIPAVSNAAVGIGMSGFGTFVEQARPNLTLNFVPHPEYWITFGTYVQGEVMDIEEITSAARIRFPANVYSMTAILDENNNWSVAPTSESLSALSLARGSKPLHRRHLAGNGESY